MTASTKTIGYWAATGLLVLGILSGGIAELLRVPANVEGIVRLGYPAYLVPLLGLAKVLATIALVVPGTPRLKEWAYAGIFFNMVGAALSHAITGDAAWHVVVTLAFAALTLASWGLRPQTRVLGAAVPSARTRDARRDASGQPALPPAAP